MSAVRRFLYKESMYRGLIILMSVMMCAVECFAQGAEQEMVRRVAEYVGKLGSYELNFEIEAEGYESAGSYVVAGDSYHIILPQAEVYSDGKARYEIDHERREVNVDVVDLTSRNVLDNPTRCFDFVGEAYELSLVEQSVNEVVVRIVATDGAFEGEIFLMADAKGKPMELKYQLYDDVIRVKIKSLAPRKAKLPTFAKSVYKDYDIIDFR